MNDDRLPTSIACPWCNVVHMPPGRCPEVQEIEYYPNGYVRRIVYRPGSRYSGVVSTVEVVQ